MASPQPSIATSASTANSASKLEPTASIPAIPPFGASDLRDRRRRVTAEAIERVALDLFAQRGYQNVTIEEIATATGLSSRTFFRYFASKEDVVVDAQDHMQRRLLKALQSGPSVGPVTALRNAYVETANIEPSQRAGVRQRYRVLTEDPMLARRGASAIARPSGALVNHLAALMRVDATRDLRPSLLAATLHAAAAAGFQQWVSSGSDDDPAVSVAAALDLVIVGVGAFDALLPKRRNRQ